MYTIAYQNDVRNAVDLRSACISENGPNARLVSPLNTSHALDTTYREILHLNTNRSAVAHRSASISDNGVNARLVSPLNTNHAFDTTYREILHMNTNRSAVDLRSASTVADASTAASVAARAAAHTKMIVDLARSASSWFSRILDRDEESLN